MKHEIKLTEKQKASAKKSGLTQKEAIELIRDAKRDEKLDRMEYEDMSQTERDAHDNL